MDGAQIPLDAADRQAPFFPQRGDAAEHVDAQALAPQCHAVQLCWGHSAPPTHWAGPGDEDMLGDLHRNHRQLDDFPGALDPAASQVRPAIRDSSPPRASTRWVGVMRGRAKPWRRCLRGCCCAGAWRPELGLRPGIRGGPPGFAWPSSSAIRRSNRSITRCCSRTVTCSWAMLAMRTSRLRRWSGHSQYPLPLYDITTATRASVRKPGSGQFTSPSLNSYISYGLMA